MRIGLFTDGLAHRPRADAIAWCADHGIHDLEMGVGTWSPRPHLNLAQLLAEPAQRQLLASELAACGSRIACVNAAGNVLHPTSSARNEAQTALRGAVELAHLLQVDTVVTMSGCPAGPGGGDVSVFPIPALCDEPSLFDWQLDHEVGPFWRETSRWATQTAPGVRICLELHPGLTVYNASSFERLTAYTASNIGVNLDPSHFWWQGVDPLSVVDALGAAVGFSHGKDTTIHADRVRVHGLFDYRHPPDSPDAPWHFSAVGDGHDVDTWSRLLASIRATGYDGVISIEHEEPTRPAEDAIVSSIRTLTQALAGDSA